MKLKGEDLSSGLVEWVKSEIKETPKQIYDLGKFFFTISVATVAALAALKKVNTNATFDLPLSIALIALLLSMLVALDLARPRAVLLAAGADLLNEYTEQVERATKRGTYWLVIWLVGTVIGGYSVIL